MLSTQATTFPSLFQAWQPLTDPLPSPDCSCDYIELPALSSYQALQQDAAFEAIQSQFLDDIQKLRHLAHKFVNQQYDDGIDFFHQRLKTPPDDLQNCLLPLYRDTRFQIHRLVKMLENHQHASTDQQAYIASQLHDCLNDIDQCPAGVHSRFAMSFIKIAADQAGLAGNLFRVRQQLFHDCIATFLFVQQREQRLDIPPIMTVHWFNSLHNLHCDALALQPVVDPLAPTMLGDDMIEHFLTLVGLSVNACTILRTFSDQWSDQLSTALYDLGIAAWETDTIAPAEITADITVTLDSKLFKPVNHLLKTSGKQPLDLWTVVEENNDGSYRLDRYREKILAWMSIYFCGPAATVFAAISARAGELLYIGTIGNLFFWVFSHSPSLCAGQPCTFDSGNHATLTLAHLTTLDFATWPNNISHALLTQAMEQTNNVEDITAFFLHRDISAQLCVTPRQIVQTLSDQLSRKLAHHREDFQNRLCQCICDRLTGQQDLISLPALHWLLDTPLLEPVLSAMLNQAGLDIFPLTRHLASWHISGFAQESLVTLLTCSDCQRLFSQALSLNQDQTVSNLLLTGHCDQLYHLLTEQGLNLLPLFACKGLLAGLNHLLKFTCTDVNLESRRGTPPLACAARYGQADCLRALLTAKGILVNKKNPEGKTPLHFAVDAGARECVEALLMADGIQVNVRTTSGWSPLDLAARYNKPQCLEALLTSGDIRINDKNSSGYAPLHCAALAGNAQCIDVLLRAEGILVNSEDNDGWTPLLCAIVHDYTECVRVLLRAKNIELNTVAGAGWTPLGCAASYDRPNSIKALLEKEGIDVNLRDHDGGSPLDYSALGRAECIRALLAVPGCRVNDRAPDGNTPLCSAARNGFKACVRALLEADDIQVNTTTDTGWTAFDLATIYGHPECLKALLATGCIDINSRNPNNVPALSSAVNEGHTACVKVLLATDGVDINQQTYGWTPLHLAARYGNQECLTALLAFDGIDINCELQSGCTALGLADMHQHEDCVRILLSRPDILIDPDTQPYCKAPLHYAARVGDADWVRALTNDNDEQVNAKDFQGYMPLHYAAIFGHEQCIEALLLTGICHVNVENPLGYNALGTAAGLGHTACTRALLSANNIDVNLNDRHGRTPLDYAASEGHAEPLQVLLAASDCLCNEKTPTGDTPLISAAMEGHTDCVRILLGAHGIAVNAQNNRGMTALLYAATSGHIECVKALLEVESIQVNRSNTTGWTPLCAATRYGHTDCVKSLLEADGIDVNAANDYGWSPLHFAAGNGHIDCLKLLLNTNGIEVNLNPGKTPLDIAVEFDHAECIRALTTAGGFQTRELSPE